MDESISEAGDSNEIRLLEKIPDILFLGVAVLVIVFFSSYFVVNSLQTGNIEMELFYNRLLYSSNTISYHDSDIGRTYLGVIDPVKVNDSNLESSMNYSGNSRFAAKIQLNDRTAYYYKSRFENLAPLARAGIGGAGGADYLHRTFNVGYIKDGELKKGILSIEIIKARS